MALHNIVDDSSIFLFHSCTPFQLPVLLGISKASVHSLTIFFPKASGKFLGKFGHRFIYAGVDKTSRVAFLRLH